MADVNNNPLTAGIRWRQGTCLDATSFAQYQAVKLTGANTYAPCTTADSDADVAGICLADRSPGQARSIPIALLTSDIPVPVLSDLSGTITAGSATTGNLTLSGTVAGAFKPAGTGIGIMRAVTSAGTGTGSIVIAAGLLGGGGAAGTTDCFPVTAYGAVGDGATDDSAAFSAALTAAIAVGSDATVCVPSGRFLLSTAISKTITSGMYLRITGEGASSVMLLNCPNTDTVLTIDATSSIAFVEVDHLVVENLTALPTPPECCDKFIDIGQSPSGQCHVHHMQFAGVYAPSDIIAIRGGVGVVDHLSYIGCATAHFVSFYCRLGLAESITHVDIGDFDGQTWQGGSYTNSTLVYCLGEVPISSETLPASHYEIRNCECDEEVFFMFRCDGTAQTIGQMRAVGLRAQITSVAGSAMVYAYKCDRVDIEDCYVNTVGDSASYILDAYTVKEVSVRRVVGETGHTSASVVRADSGGIRVEDCNCTVVTSGMAIAYLQKNGMKASAVGAALTVSSNTIAPNANVHSVGAGLIKTITVPYTGFTGSIVLIPSAAFTYDNTGNITPPTGGANTAVVGQPMTATYDGTTWWMSY